MRLVARAVCAIDRAISGDDGLDALVQTVFFSTFAFLAGVEVAWQIGLAIARH